MATFIYRVGDTLGTCVSAVVSLWNPYVKGIMMPFLSVGARMRFEPPSPSQSHPDVYGMSWTLGNKQGEL